MSQKLINTYCNNFKATSLSCFFFEKTLIKPAINQFIATFQNNVSLYIKREDLLHPFVSGNKLRKLKYNILEAKCQKKDTLITFGGAFSNHIAAVAYAGFENGLKTIGIIRGDELQNKIEENPTLSFAKKHGMLFEFISREVYRMKNSLDYINKIATKYPNSFLIPEGGTNSLAIKGCEEILTLDDQNFDYICTCVGTAGTISGLINSAKTAKILGFSALKGNFLENEIAKWTVKHNWELNTDYHFGGYAKVTDELIIFINNFKKQYQIPLDPVYTSKMVFGVLDLIEKNYFAPNTKILMIHTGGLQGIAGMNQLLRKQNKTLIDTDE